LRRRSAHRSITEEERRSSSTPGEVRTPEGNYEGYRANGARIWDVSSPAQVIAASCSSYYISEITLVSPGDTEAGRVQTFVGFGASKEEAEKNALGSCSHIQLDLETCLASDRILGRNAPSDEANSSLHLKYTKAVKRITGCD
jgi:hypothetical protein